MRLMSVMARMTIVATAIVVTMIISADDSADGNADDNDNDSDSDDNDTDNDDCNDYDVNSRFPARPHPRQHRHTTQCILSHF